MIMAPNGPLGYAAAHALHAEGGRAESLDGGPALAAEDADLAADRVAELVLAGLLRGDGVGA
jgi:hypothetical protein